jgi:hypothetical protein
MACLAELSAEKVLRNLSTTLSSSDLADVEVASKELDDGVFRRCFVLGDAMH